MRQIAVIGSASIAEEYVKELAQQVGVEIAKLNCHLVCGGLSGVMLESSRGFKSIETDGKVIGLLPSYDPETANEFVDIRIPTGMDIGRNQLVVSSADVVIAIGGGAGTLSEISMASQLGKSIILIKSSGGWADKIDTSFLDSRENSRLYHLENINDLQQLLLKLTLKVSKSVMINSGADR
jgi:uncharacterized protein (TIGR00725 family)